MYKKEILVVGLNHRTAPVEVREKVAFDYSSLGEALKRLHSHPGIKEGVILSTCNRVEVIAAEFGRQLNRAFKGTIGDHQAAYAAALQVARHQVAHFPGANEHDGLVFQAIEYPLCQIHRHRTH